MENLPNQQNYTQESIPTPKVEVEPQFAEFVPQEFLEDPLGYFEREGRNIKTGELNFDAIKESPDGRITAEYFALIKKLQSEGILTKLICFNEGSGGHGWNARDAAMAKDILDNLSDVPTLVVAGKLHTKTEPLSFDDEPGEHYPMALNIKRVIPDVASGAIEYLSGHYHNYGIEEFSTTSDQTIPTQAKFYKNKDGHFIFELPKATAATVPHPSDRI